MLISTGIFVLFLNIISNIGGRLKMKKNIQRFGTFYEHTNYKSLENRKRLPHFYINIFLLRRLLYVLIILFLYEYPLIQQIMNIIIHTLAFLYDLKMHPYPINVLGLLTYFLNFVVAVIFASLPVYLKPRPFNQTLGRIHIYILIATFILSWMIIIGMNIFEIYKKYKNRKSTPVAEPPLPSKRVFVMVEEVLYIYIYILYIY